MAGHRTVAYMQYAVNPHHVRAVHRFAHAMQIRSASSGHHEVVGEHRGANEIHAGQEGLVVVRQACHDGLAEPRAKPLLVQHGGEQRREGLWLHFAMLAESVHVGLECEQLVEGDHVAGKAGQTHEDFVGNFKYFLEIFGHCLGLDTKTQVTEFAKMNDLNVRCNDISAM